MHTGKQARMLYSFDAVLARASWASLLGVTLPNHVCAPMLQLLARVLQCARPGLGVQHLTMRQGRSRLTATVQNCSLYSIAAPSSTLSQPLAEVPGAWALAGRRQAMCILQSTSLHTIAFLSQVL